MESELMDFLKAQHPEIWETYLTSRRAAMPEIRDPRLVGRQNTLVTNSAPRSKTVKPCPATASLARPPTTPSGPPAPASSNGPPARPPPAPTAKPPSVPSARPASDGPSSQNSDSLTNAPPTPGPSGKWALSKLSDTEEENSNSDSNMEVDFQVVTNKRKRRVKSLLETAAPAKKTAQPSVATEPRKEKPPPPIILQEKGKWSTVSKWMASSNIISLKAQSTGQGVKFHLAKIDEFRTVTKHLKTQNIGFHTFSLPEEKRLRVVIRGYPLEEDLDLVDEELRKQGLPILSLARMVHPKHKNKMSLIMATLDLTPEGKAIYNLKTLCGLSGISVEAPRKTGIIGQCYRCQYYGHSARNCFAHPRCVKCVGDHATADCPREKGTKEPPQCVLCDNNGHPANYRGCSKAPRRMYVSRPNYTQPRLPTPRSQANPRETYVPAPLPTKPAWSNAPVWNNAPASTIDQASSVPQVVIKPVPPTPPKGNDLPQLSVAAEISQLLSYLKNINIPDILVLSRELRASRSGEERLNVILQHMDTINALWTNNLVN